MNSKKHINYPYLPGEGHIAYVPADNPFMQAAKCYSRQHSIDKTMPTGSVIVHNGILVSQAANGSDYHETHVCERVRLNVPTGQGYELCEGCNPKNHSEPRAIANALSYMDSIAGADLYLWGHWWCCEPCWNVMLEAGIKTVYLLENSEVLFNKEADGNIVGKQFD